MLENVELPIAKWLSTLFPNNSFASQKDCTYIVIQKPYNSRVKIFFHMPQNSKPLVKPHAVDSILLSKNLKSLIVHQIQFLA